MSTVSSVATPPDQPPGGYRPGLDGIRAIAVSAVLLFHLDRLPGGYLGVDAFFVLSGWLITWKLLGEADRHGTIRLRAFWAARVRRIMPASLAVLCAIAVVWPLAGIDVPSLRRDLLWATGWLSNWGTITGGGNYWARFDEPSPVTHFWSLAIEEQFYLVWPAVVLLAGLRSRRHRAVVAAVGAVAALASVVAMNLMFDPSDPTATYMNTFARVHSLLIGAVVAAGTSVRADGRLRGGGLARRLAPIGVPIAIGIVALASDDATWMFRWGFAVFALATATAVVAAADGAGDRWLAAAPMRWLGDRSYGLYLWHWPVFILLSADRLGVSDSAMSRALLDAVRVAVAVLLADISFRFLETPIRRRRVLTQRFAGVVAVLSVAAVVLVTAINVAEPRNADVSVVTLPPPSPSPSTVPVSTPPAPTDPASSNPTVTSAPPTSPASIPTGTVPERVRPALRVLVAGDSTGLHLSEVLIAYADGVPDRLIAGAAAFGGCGLSGGDDGRLHAFTTTSGERELVDLSECAVLWDAIPQRVIDEAIDVVLVQIGAWDAVDIHLTDGSVVSVGDPVGAPLVEASYRRFVERIDDAGARVVWITPPDIDPAIIDDPLSQPARWVALRSIIAELGVVEIDLPGWLITEGMSGPEGRPDGVHLTAELNEQFVVEVVAPTLDALRDDGEPT